MKNYAIIKIKESELTNDILNSLAELNGDIVFTSLNDGMYSFIFAKEKRQKKENDKSEFVDRLVNIGVSIEAAQEWHKIRKKKKAVNTDIAIDRIIKELECINNTLSISPDDAVRICVFKSWMGIKKEWFEKEAPTQSQKSNNDELVINGVIFK